MPSSYYKIGTDVYGTEEGKLSLDQFQNLGLNFNLLGEGAGNATALDSGQDVETRSFISGGGQLGGVSAAQQAGYNFDPTTGQLTTPQGTGSFGAGSVPTTQAIGTATQTLADKLKTEGAVSTSELPSEQSQFLKNMEDRQKTLADIASRIMSLSVPSESVQKTQEQLNQEITSSEQGINEILNRPSSQGFITGAAAAAERQANTRIGNLQRQLQLQQGSQELQLNTLKTAYELNRQSVQDNLAFYQATAPQSFFVDANSGNAYFRNPITGAVSSQKLPGFQAKPKGYESGIIGEYQYYADQETAAGKKPLSFSEYQDVDANRKAKASGVGGLTTAQYLTQIGRMADDVRSDPDVKDFIQIRDGYERVQTGATLNNAQGDLALLFGYMKILDPNSVVRETEFANAEAAMGYAQRILNIPAKFIAGARLTEEARGHFATAAKALYRSKEQNYQKAVDFYTNQANTIGLDPKLVLRNFESSVNDQQQSEADITETIQANSGENREQLIERLVPAFPEFTLDEIARYVYTLIPDKQ